MVLDERVLIKKFHESQPHLRVPSSVIRRINAFSLHHFSEAAVLTPEQRARLTQSFKFEPDGFRSRLRFDEKAIPPGTHLHFHFGDSLLMKAATIEYDPSVAHTYAGTREDNPSGVILVHPPDGTGVGRATFVSRTGDPVFGAITVSRDRPDGGLDVEAVNQFQFKPSFEELVHPDATLRESRLVFEKDAPPELVSDGFDFVKHLYRLRALWSKPVASIHFTRSEPETADSEVAGYTGRLTEKATGAVVQHDIFVAIAKSHVMPVEKAATHEGFHVVYGDERNKAARAAYDAFFEKTMRPVFAGDASGQREARFYAMIDESTYLGEAKYGNADDAPVEDQLFGHPYSNSEEAAASTLNNAFHHGPKVLEKLKNLKDDPELYRAALQHFAHCFDLLGARRLEFAHPPLVQHVEGEVSVRRPGK